MRIRKSLVCRMDCSFVIKCHHLCNRCSFYRSDGPSRFSQVVKHACDFILIDQAFSLTTCAAFKLFLPCRQGYIEQLLCLRIRIIRVELIHVLSVKGDTLQAISLHVINTLCLLYTSDAADEEDSV